MKKLIAPVMLSMLIFTACGGDSDDAPEAEATPTAVVTQAETQVVEEPTPTPSRPKFPVSIARLAIAMTDVEPWLCSVTPNP